MLLATRKRTWLARCTGRQMAESWSHQGPKITVWSGDAKHGRGLHLPKRFAGIERKGQSVKRAGDALAIFQQLSKKSLAILRREKTHSSRSSVLTRVRVQVKAVDKKAAIRHLVKDVLLF